MEGGMVPEDPDWRQLQHPALSHGSHSLLLSRRAKIYGGHCVPGKQKSHYLAVIPGDSRFQSCVSLQQTVTSGEGKSSQVTRSRLPPLAAMLGGKCACYTEGTHQVQASLPAWKLPQGVSVGMHPELLG